ncbi:MAG: cupin domain-containing protein [archaeon]
MIRLLRGNIFHSISRELPNELIETMVKNRSLSIGRIVSKAHITPKDEWYNQKTNEFVILLQGRSTLKFQKKRENIILKKGDYLMIPRGCKHRVEKTSSKPPAVWLVVHYR